MYFSKSINNVKRFLKDDARDCKPIGCVAATLNNSVLYKTHISCDETVNYFVCKQSEYFFMGMSALFLPMVDFLPLVIFSVISLRICNIINATKFKIKQILIKTKRNRHRKRMINTKKNTHTHR
jgi:hypothetical protein